ncbi:Acetyltransferase [Roseobacter fucihabitans]|uniref:Acetyltransferase n=1 Tax=Roseobacter fucihabitans TaxID=1537242 RepID=A0ABZ2BLW6_9RHOB|nr:GNAT family N-acetyltransferase [Roseobacter litoralis]MBC6966497.1 putative N-acetyltransferase YjcF [Roseobacter litoralis]
MTFDIALSDDIVTCQALRRIVFIEEQRVSEVDEVDGRDGEALHLLARADTRPIGTARLLIYGDTTKIGRVCVLRDHRGKGFGAALIRAAVEIARDQHNVRRVQLGAQIQALAFYEKLGFAAFGPIYDDAGIDHRDMEHVL